MASDPFGLGKHPLLALLLLFLAGLGLAFTPCVLPMLPIVANLVAHQHRRSAWHGFQLSAAYGLGVASSYALLGVLVALFGHQFNLVGWLQQPVVLLSFAALFTVLSLNAADLLPLRLPFFVRDFFTRLHGRTQTERFAGSLAGSLAAGFTSALVVSPCISAPLAGVLLSVSTVGSPLLGAAALFMLGLGLSTPLMLVGATEGKLLPRSGEWLERIRHLFALLLLAVAVMLVGRVFQEFWVLSLWAALGLVLAYGLYEWQGQGRVITRSAALGVAIWSALELVGAAMGHTDPVQPLRSTSAAFDGMPAPQSSAEGESPFSQRNPSLTPVRVTSWPAAQALIHQHPRVLIDVTAEWCVSCKIMDREIFAQPPAQLAGWQLVKLDVTETTPETQAALEALSLFGPPALLLYQQGQPVGRLVGEVSRKELVKALDPLSKGLANGIAP